MNHNSLKKVTHSLILIILIFSQIKGFSMEGSISDKEQQILEFWFGILEREDEWDPYKAKLWFEGNPTLDQTIRDTFGLDILKAAAGDYDDWKATPQGTLALIILLDQFPRNVFRGTPQAFQFDSLAQSLVINGIESGLDQKLYPIQRHFFYLPLMHAESLDLQELSLLVFKRLKEEALDKNKSYFSSVETYAISHYELIETYGRFPYRNVILNRLNTDAEIEYLKQSTSSYGQTPVSTK